MALSCLYVAWLCYPDLCSFLDSRLFKSAEIFQMHKTVDSFIVFARAMEMSPQKYEKPLKTCEQEVCKIAVRSLINP